MTKEPYITPIMEVCTFDTEDVITTSGELINGGTEGTPETVAYTDVFQ